MNVRYKIMYKVGVEKTLASKVKPKVWFRITERPLHKFVNLRGRYIE